jgi:hypothetical protein
VQHFTPLAVPAEQSVDPVVVRYAGGEFASYIDTDSAAPFMTGLRAALEAPLHSSQVLNTAIALSNVVALLALSLAQDESEAVDLVNGSIRRSATVAFPELVPESDQDLVNSAEALVCRVFGTVTRDELPDALDGRTLAAIAAFGDAAILLADQIGLPRPVLAAAIGQAAATM